MDEQDFRVLAAEAWKGMGAYLRSRNLHQPGELDLGRSGSVTELETRFIAILRDIQGLGIGQEDVQGAVDAGLTALAAHLKDDHVAFIPARFWQELRTGRVSSYGYYSTSLPNSAERVVREVITGGPAEAAGLKLGDVIFEIEGEYVTPATVLRPDADGYVSMTVRRGTEALPVRIQQQRVAIDEFRASLLDGNVGYLRLISFPVSTSCDVLNRYQASLEDALKSQAAEGARGWVIDLRGNTGGSIAAAAYLLGRLDVEGLIATTIGRGGATRRQEALSSNGIGSAPLAILIDERSASASEIVAAAVQESRRGQIIGVKSRGSVVAATVFQVAGGALEFTVARIEVGPSNKVYDKIGVNPDTNVPLDKDLLRRDAKDNQLQAAIDYIQQKLGR